MQKREFVFLGGPLHEEPEERKKTAEAVRCVEGIIAKHGMQYHPHLLTDKSVGKGIETAAKDVKVGGKKFDRLMAAVSKSHLNLLKKMRWYETEEKLLRCAAVGDLIRQQAANSSAGIFVLTAPSAGSYLTVGELLGKSVPVLVTSNQNLFGTYLTGHPSPFLKTARYESLNDLEQIADDFLEKIDNFKSQSKSVRLPILLAKQAEIIANERGDTFTDVLVDALQEYFERLNSGNEAE